MAFSRRSRPSDPPEPPADPYTLALRWLGARELTEHQVRQRLARRAVAPSDIDTVVERLRAVRAIDDVRVANAFARTAAQVKGRGRTRVARELSALGLDDALVRQAVDAASPAEAERERLDLALARKARGIDVRDRAARQRLIASLARRGFELEAILKALRRFGHGDGADE